MTTRRAFIVAAGMAGLAAVGAGVDVAVAHRTSLLHRLGLAHSPDRVVPDAHVPQMSGTLRSSRMRRTVDWTIATPPAPVEGVIFCLHGHGDNHRFAFDQIHVPDVVASIGARLAVAAVDGGLDSYWHPRADGTDALGMLLDEFVPMVDARLGVDRRALLGWSMGGYGALLAAETAPQRFRAVAAASPALWTSPSATAPGAFDSAADYHRYDVFARTDALSGLVTRVDCGTSDPFYAAAKKLVARLRTQQSSFLPGFHDAAYWRSVAPAQVATVNAALQ